MGPSERSHFDLKEEIVYNDEGLVPCIVQDWGSGEVLMLAHMSRESLEKTVDSGEMYFWSRSRGELWKKGATSGNTQALRELRYDCDVDALLALVEPAGPACHTGERSCFFRSIDSDDRKVKIAPHEALPTLARTLARRHRELPSNSYTAELLRSGAPRIAEKIVEEADEVTRAGAEESDRRVCEEAADLLYHLGVLLELRGLSFADALEVLTTRMKQ